ncbi:hypothetical protein DPEC_G00065940 [Dallia pectoralis]|uniref:Uncharacterized protein n=1 Tax=Dallia pectoralis TaxID=75939 RepID=A0ACC2H867_DALPE|nr:hypothetical protein DPEC_G00065940 [Dallia pectoralis]
MRAVPHSAHHKSTLNNRPQGVAAALFGSYRKSLSGSEQAFETTLQQTAIPLFQHTVASSLACLSLWQELKRRGIYTFGMIMRDLNNRLIESLFPGYSWFVRSAINTTNGSDSTGKQEGPSLSSRGPREAHRGH